MEEDLLSNYAGAGGKFHGIKFPTEDKTVKCNGTSDMGKLVCQVKGQKFPESNRAEDGLQGMGAPTDVVGWDAAVSAPLHAEPKVWTKQGTIPYTEMNGILKSRMKIGDENTDAWACGALDAGTMICVSGGHGVKVSTSEYETW